MNHAAGARRDPSARREPMGRVHRLRRTATVAVEREKAFAFFSDPRNLEELVPRWVGFRLLAVEPEPTEVGTRVRYRLGPWGLVRWTSRFVEWDPPRFFVDEQESGPFALWRHEHGFASVPAGTRVEDRVLYALPFGPVGRMSRRLVVGPLLRAAFDHRERTIRELLGP